MDNRRVFVACGAASVIMMAVALHLWGAAEIRANPGEVVFLCFIGAFWLIVARGLFSWFGVSYRDDVVERGNASALAALCGALTAAALVYIGGSLGEGPSYWNNFFSAGLALAGLFALWILLELGAKVSVSITEERDLASGLRMGGFLIATGLILGRAVAGDWHSEAATVRDFIHDGGPAAFLCAIAVCVERFARPSRRQPAPPWLSYGLIPALFYLAFAAAWVWHLGAWEGMPT